MDQQESLKTKDFGTIILTGTEVVVPKSDERIERLATMAYAIYSLPKKRRKRTPQQIIDDCSNIMIEEALTIVNPGFVCNPKEFNVSDPDSYNHDVYFQGQTKKYTFEVKRMRQKAVKWQTYNLLHLKTFINNFQKVDQVVCGKVFEADDCWKVGFHLVADAKSYLPDDEMVDFLHNSSDFSPYILSVISDVPDNKRCLRQTQYTDPSKPWTFYGTYYDRRKSPNSSVFLDENEVEYSS